jgi:hypothetical protein
MTILILKLFPSAALSTSGFKGYVLSPLRQKLKVYKVKRDVL